MKKCKKCGKPLTFFSGYIPLKGEMCVECYFQELQADAEKEVRRMKA